MTRFHRLLLYGYLVASLCGFLEPFCELAFCGSAMDWMRQEKEAFRSARDQEAANYYSKALEMRNYYSKALEADPKLLEKQETWVRERVKSGKSADLLERIDVKLADVSLPLRKDLIEKNYKELIIGASFLEKLMADELNDFKAYRRGINIKNAVVIGDLDLSKAEVSPPVTISKCIFLGKIDLSDSWFERGLNLEGSHFLQAVNANSLKVGHSAFFNDAVFGGPVDFTLMNITLSFVADGARFESNAGFNGLKVGNLALFNNKVVFKGRADFTLANTGLNLEANEARFESTADFNSLKVGDHALFNKKVVFKGLVDFTGANIASNFGADGARFERKADFNALKVGRSAFFNNAVCRGPVDFTLASTAVNFEADGARFESNADFNSLKAGNLALFNKKVVFKGPVDFTLANIASNFEANGARFESTKGKADFNSLKVGNLALFNKKVVFKGPVDFTLANIAVNFEANKALFESTKDEVNFKSLKVGHEAQFSNAIFRRPVNFGCANLCYLYLVGTTFPEKKGIMLDGMTYKNVFTKEGNYCDHNTALEICKKSPYCPQPYSQLESCYTEIGNKEGANAVNIEGKRQEWKTANKGLCYLPGNILKLKSAEYSRDLNGVIWFVIGFIVFGTYIFSRPNMFKNEGKLSVCSGFWYSLGSFLPFVTLGACRTGN